LKAGVGTSFGEGAGIEEDCSRAVGRQGRREGGGNMGSEEVEKGDAD
jgi:hypothetical protein